MKILVVGSGGREHCLVWKLAQSKHVQKIYAAPGNGGISQQAECIDIKADDINSLAEFALNNSIDLTVVGPELPLVLGIVDEFNKRGLKIFGPTKKAAMLEGSKAFAKKLMNTHGIPTARGEVFKNSQEAISYIKSINTPVVVKADGLAAGKGVIICNSKEDAFNAITDIMDKKVFGSAGDTIIIEECLEGEEVSILAFSDGLNVLSLVPSQDHKRALDNDKGLNTGGMGAYSPVPIINNELSLKIQKEILEPTIRAMSKEGIPYTGIIYAGLMITSTGPKVLEYNVRFGDPETQVVLPRLESDLLEPILASMTNSISNLQLQWSKNTCICIVMASGGYPGKYEKGKSIKGLEKVSSVKESVVFHAGTKMDSEEIVTNGGRVLGITALGDTIENAINLGYKVINEIYFENAYYRKDIGKKALCR